MNPNISIKYKIVVKDKDGKTIAEREEVSRSLLKNFMLLLNALFRKTSNDVVDTTGSVVAGGAKGSAIFTYSITGWGDYSVGADVSEYGGLLVGAGEGDDTYGIVVGSGTDPVSPEDYNLASKIAHGTSDGQLYYKEQVVGIGVVVEGGIIKQAFSRVFRNDGSVAVTINEIGLVVDIPVDGYKVLIIRDVLDNPVTAPSGGYIIASYYIEVS